MPHEIIEEELAIVTIQSYCITFNKRLGMPLYGDPFGFRFFYHKLPDGFSRFALHYSPRHYNGVGVLIAERRTARGLLYLVSEINPWKVWNEH